MGHMEEHYERGLALKQEGRYDEAEIEFRAIIELDIDHA